MRINKTKSQLVWFAGFDGKVYAGHTLGIKNDILTVCYKIKDGFKNVYAKAFLETDEYTRISKRNPKSKGAVA